MLVSQGTYSLTIASNCIYTVYLIHFRRKLYHAQHYVGLTPGDPFERLRKHRDGVWTPTDPKKPDWEYGHYVGQGAKILGACNHYGIDYDIVRMWVDVDPRLEFDLKDTKHVSRYCPACTRRPLDLK